MSATSAVTDHNELNNSWLHSFDANYGFYPWRALVGTSRQFKKWSDSL